MRQDNFILQWHYILFKGKLLIGFVLANKILHKPLTIMYKRGSMQHFITFQNSKVKIMMRSSCCGFGIYVQQLLLNTSTTCMDHHIKHFTVPLCGV